MEKLHKFFIILLLAGSASIVVIYTVLTILAIVNSGNT